MLFTDMFASYSYQDKMLRVQTASNMHNAQRKNYSLLYLNFSIRIPYPSILNYIKKKKC